ncbi:MAG: alanine racemase [Betaproteobacteria bacterium]|nr:MAG: alanine racemase [Betaproteobacteria bacterium]
MIRPTFATINLGALRHNLEVARRHASGSKTFAVVKANAYGHGLMRAAPALAAAEGFALLDLEEAIRLRAAGYRQRILLLEGFFSPSEFALFAEHRLCAVVHNREQLRMLRQLPKDAALDVFLKINTGMNRLGFTAAEFPDALRALQSNPGVKQIALMTHFADADGTSGVEWQTAVFDRLANRLDLPRSLANSAAVFRFPETHADWVRPGIMLYGCSPFAEQSGTELGLVPAMTLESRIIAVQQLRRGDVVGYGKLFVADRDTRIGVVTCGYADGYPRHAPTGTPIMVEGRMTRTVGRVSMDMLCADLSDIPEALVGSRVVLWGESAPVERVAEAAGTVGYELLCGLAPRVPVRERE